MSFFRWLAFAAISVAPAVYAAQNQTAISDPADPAGAATSFRYESVFSGYSSADKEDTAPDKVWRSANEEMGRLGGHAGHMKNSQQPSPSPAAGNAGTSPVKTPAVTAAPPANAPAMPADHSGHGMRH